MLTARRCIRVFVTAFVPAETSTELLVSVRDASGTQDKHVEIVNTWKIVKLRCATALGERRLVVHRHQATPTLVTVGQFGAWIPTPPVRAGPRQHRCMTKPKVSDAFLKFPIQHVIGATNTSPSYSLFTVATVPNRCKHCLHIRYILEHEVFQKQTSKFVGYVAKNGRQVRCIVH